MKIVMVSGLVIFLVVFYVVSLVWVPSVRATSDYEVKFRGTVIIDERSLSSTMLNRVRVYTMIVVHVILYDPNALLTVGSNVTVIYDYSLNLRTGEYVDCFGVKDEGCRLSNVATSYFIRCCPEPYYVRRMPFFSMLSMILTLSMVATPLLALYFYRKGRYEANLKREIQKV